MVEGLGWWARGGTFSLETGLLRTVLQTSLPGRGVGVGQKQGAH